jgi:tRNA pseudouridine38-40 synthase
MQQASIALLGTHDFASFGKPPQGNNTVRTVFQANWQRNGSEITFNIGANAFLYRMVRNIVGALLQVGLGQMTVDEFKAVLQARDRSKAGPPAPPQGLCLVKVNYTRSSKE